MSSTQKNRKRYQISLSEKSSNLLETYFLENGIPKSVIVDLAIQEYLKGDEEGGEDGESQETA